MNNQKLVIYDFHVAYEILHEIENELNFKIINIDKENLKNFNNIKDENCILLARKKVSDFDNQIVLNEFPIKISKLIEIFNIEFLKINYKELEL